jgi:hypothetical protein
MKSFGLDMLQCLSLSSYAYQLALCKSHVKCELIQDEVMIQFCKRALRGPIELSCMRLGTSNTERLHNFNGNDADRREILYVDINGMYPACCMKALAIGNYRWLDQKELDELDITNLPEGKGMLIECARFI